MNGWTEVELAAAVEAYRQLQASLASGSELEKARVYRELAASHGRSTKAWEYRMQNISYVLEQAGEPWLPGLRPAANVGAKVQMQLARLLARPEESPHALSGLTRTPLEKQDSAAEANAAFIATSELDERERVLAAIVCRRGQPAFRVSLLKAYGGCCAMTGCEVVDALEAAHIRPYLGQASNMVTNGLLLRADIHTLFDLHLISVDAASRRIAIGPSLWNSEYFALQGQLLAAPINAADAASPDAITWHRARCTW